MYLEKSDYTRIDSKLLELLLTEDENEILSAANKIAMDTIKTKVGVLYNITGELEKTADARNGYILSLAMSIGLFEIYQRIDSEDIPKKVIKNYDDAMDTLDDISKGKSPLDLPAKGSESDGTPGGDDTVGTVGKGLRRIGSLPRRTHTI